jgi:response regulator RpfG family c-di-GMP phosphodiesterase
MNTKPRILLVDDDPVNLKLISRLLGSENYETLLAKSGDEALMLMSIDPPDLVFLDVLMPGMNGFDVCQRIKEDERTMGVPVVIVTALDNKDDKITAIEAGADDFISKPVDKAELHARTKSLLKQKRYRDERDLAYESIIQMTSFFGKAIKDFSSLRDSNPYEMIFSNVLRDIEDFGDSPLGAIILPDAKDNTCMGSFMYVSGGKLQTELIACENLTGFTSQPWFPDKSDSFLNIPLSDDLQAMMPKETFRNTGTIKNLVACRINNTVIICFNYAKNVSIYDTHVLRSLLNHSIFFETLSDQIIENEEAFTYTINALARAAEANDEDTGNHIQRVGEYSYEVAKDIGLSEREAEVIRYSAVTHDVGKLHISPELLQKRDKLTNKEFEAVKQHTNIGARILGQAQRLDVAREIALCHHERWDGSGYPRGLKGNMIPLSGRIVAIADIYDALRTERTYKPTMSHDAAVNIITNGDGRTKPEHFDPKIFKSFTTLTDKFETIYNNLSMQQNHS